VPPPNSQRCVRCLYFPVRGRCEFPHFLMRLHQGPNGVVQDFAAQMMARLFGKFLPRAAGSHILPATAATPARPWHTRSTRFPASASSCCYRHGSERKPAKLMTRSRYIRTVAIDGKFDDCQAMVETRRSPTRTSSTSRYRRPTPSISAGCCHRACITSTRRPAWQAATDRVLRASGNFGDMMGGWSPRDGSAGAQDRPPSTKRRVPQIRETGSYQKFARREFALQRDEVGHPSNLARCLRYGGQMDETERSPDADLAASVAMSSLHHLG